MPACQIYPAETYQAMFDEQLPLITAAKKGDPQALAKLEQMSRPLRRSKAQKFLPNRPDLHEDAAQAAWKGVLNSLRKWSPAWQRLFLAYAHWDVSEAIREFKYQMELTVSRPTHMHRKLAKLTKYNTTDAGELSQLSGLTLSAVKNILAIKQGDLSLQQLQTENENGGGAKYFNSHLRASPPTKEIDSAELQKLLKKALNTLNEREVRIITLYYHTDSTFGQIAQTMNLTRQRVEQINLSALLKLQKFFLKKDPALAGSISRPKTNPKKRRAKNLLSIARV